MMHQIFSEPARALPVILLKWLSPKTIFWESVQYELVSEQSKT